MMPSTSPLGCENGDKMSADATAPLAVTKDEGRPRKVLQPVKVVKSSVNRKGSTTTFVFFHFQQYSLNEFRIL